MSTPAPRITLVDATLRDGSHAKEHQFTVAEVRAVSRALDRAGVDVIEVSHGDGLGGSSLNFGRSGTDELTLIAAAAEELRQARLSVLLIPGVGVKDDLRRALERGASVARIATHCTEADIAEQHIGLARELGMTAIGFLMLSHMISPAELARQAAIMAGAGAEAVYVTDSAGSLLPSDARSRVAALRDALPETIAIGFHGHQNMSCAVANSLAAVEAGATWIDGCSRGLGAGTGNAPTEILAAVFEKAGIEVGADVFALMNVAEEIVAPLMPRPLIVDRSGLTLGFAGVYSSFLVHAEHASEQFGVPVEEILIAVGRRCPVAGQEDMIVAVGAELAERRARENQ